MAGTSALEAGDDVSSPAPTSIPRQVRLLAGLCGCWLWLLADGYASHRSGLWQSSCRASLNRTPVPADSGGAQVAVRLQALSAAAHRLLLTSRVLPHSEAQLEAGTSYFAAAQQLGSRDCGPSYLGSMGGQPCCVKRLASAGQQDALQRLAAVLATLQHPNMCPLLGWGLCRGQGCLVFALAQVQSRAPLSLSAVR